MSATKPSTLAILNAAGQLGIALGIVVQIATGVVGYPTPPPGAVLAVVVAALVLFVRWRYMLIVGLLFSVWITIGALVTPGTGQRLADPASVGPFLGTALQVLALAVGIITGVIGTVRLLRGRQTAS
ncbi:MAG: hypothetical protein JOZ47_12385 [Kutzneria sp.]|nr:hypothetical protein [Kutzneria sp.]MBV9845859.1 hypothetical protein [Kutzneria sp.]